MGLGLNFNPHTHPTEKTKVEEPARAVEPINRPGVLPIPMQILVQTTGFVFIVAGVILQMRSTKRKWR